MKTTLTRPNDREMHISRTFDAPRELVWKAWTDPAQIVKWWGPVGFTTTSHGMEVKPGGSWRLTMHGPDGTDYKNKINYLEVVPHEKLVYQHAGNEEGEDPVNFSVQVNFESSGRQTKVTMQMKFATAAELEHVIKTYHADTGAQETIGRLAEHIEKMQGMRASA